MDDDRLAKVAKNETSNILGPSGWLPKHWCKNWTPKA